MKFNIFYDGVLEDSDAGIEQVLEWLLHLGLGSPDDFYVDIDIKEGTKL